MRRAIIFALILCLSIAIIAVPMSTVAARAAAPGRQQQQPPPPPPSGQQGQQPPSNNVQISVSTNLVNVDAVVTDSDGNFLQGLKKENFRVLEDGKPQIISNFTPSGEAPITIVMLLEFRASMATWNYTAMVARYWAPEFLRNVKKNDWIALEDFDLHMRVDVDFTHDPMEIMQELQHMQVPLFSEACLFDALMETLDRIHDVKGKKAILILASGHDTFSKHTLDDALKAVKKSDVSIYCIGLTQILLNAQGAIGNINTQQSQNQLRAFAELTGGQAWNPDLDGQVPEIMRTVAASLRNQYSLGFSPNDLDGKYHKIKVELVAADGGPFVWTNQKGKKVKLQVFSREGYTATKPQVGD
jgi:VWFA-related protein